MQPTLCSRCKKNVAVIFITRMDGGEPKNEGLCLKCARELHIKPVDDVINKMGLTDDELDGLTNEMMEALGNADGLMDIENSESDSDDDGKTATFPFLNRLMGQMGGQPQRQDSNSNLPAQGGGSSGQQSGAQAQSAPWFASRTPQPGPSACAALRASFSVPIGAYSAHGTEPPKSTAWLSVSAGIGARSAAAAVA